MGTSQLGITTPAAQTHDVRGRVVHRLPLASDTQPQHYVASEVPPFLAAGATPTSTSSTCTGTCTGTSTGTTSGGILTLHGRTGTTEGVEVIAGGPFCKVLDSLNDVPVHVQCQTQQHAKLLQAAPNTHSMNVCIPTSICGRYTQ